MGKFVKGPVKLGKAGKPALKGNVRNGMVRGEQQGLGIAHPGQLDIIREGKAGDPLELVGEVVAADKELPRYGFQRNVFRKVAVYIGGNTVDLVGDIVKVRMVGVYVFVPVQVDQAQEFNKFIVYGELTELVGALGEVIYIVQLFHHGPLVRLLKAIDGNFFFKNTVNMLHAALKGRKHGRNGELDNQTLIGVSLRIDGLVQQGGAQYHNVTAAHVVPDAVDQMAGAFIQEDTDFVELVKVLELHIDGIGAFVVVEEIIEFPVRAPDFYFVFRNVDQRIVDQHGSFLPEHVFAA